MKTAIIFTHKLRTNYGGLLQAYALQKFLKSQGVHAVTDNDCISKDSWKARMKYILYRLYKVYISRDKRFKPILTYPKHKDVFEFVGRDLIQFIEKYIEVVDFQKDYLSKSTIPHYDYYVVGSDQVWRYAKNVLYYYLPYDIGENSKVISYAASFGLDDINEYPLKTKCEAQRLLKRFNAVSVRELSGVEICKNEFCVDAVHTIDPTFLLSKDDYNDIINDGTLIETHRDYVCTYILDSSEYKNKIVQEVSGILNIEKKVNNMPLHIYGYRNPVSLSQCVFISVQQWLYNIRNSNFIITDSFHGVVFSIIFNKQFVVILNKERGNARFESLLKRLNLTDRIIDSKTNIENLVNTVINYNEVNHCIKKWQLESVTFLKENIYG